MHRQDFWSMVLVVVCSFLISWLMLASVGAWAVTYVDDGFEGPGAEYGSWTENDADGAGTDYDWDDQYSTGSVTNPGADWGSYCLRDVRTGGADTQHEYGTAALNITGAIYFQFAWNFSSNTGNINRVFKVIPQGGGTAFRVYIRSSSSQRFTAEVWDSGAETEYNWLGGAPTADTTYVFKFLWDIPNNEWDWYVNDVRQPNNIDGTDPIESIGTLTATHATELDTFVLGFYSYDNHDWCYDQIWISDDGWRGEAAAGSVPAMLIQTGDL